MKPDILKELKSALCAALMEERRQLFTQEQIKIPAKKQAAGLYLPDETVFDPEDCGLVLGVSPVLRSEREGDWLYFILTDAFYSACVETINASLPFPAGDGGSLAQNRMLAGSRRGGAGCPDDGHVQRALLLLLASQSLPGISGQARRALLTMTHHLPPGERAALSARCGGVCQAAARLLALHQESST
jgi:hypothetical protein